MATRYWVGGTGTWTSTNTANWSDTSGGSGGASVPNASDDVIFNNASSSSAYAISVSNNSRCLSLTASSTNPLTFNSGSGSSLNVSGDVSVSGNITFNILLTIRLLATSTGKTFYSGVYGASTIVFQGIGSGWTMSGVWGGSISLEAGTLDMGSTIVNAAPNSPFGTTASASTKVLNLNNSTITATTFNFLDASSTTINAGTSNLTSTTNGTTGLSSAGFTFYNFSFTPTGTLAFGFIDVSGNNTFNNLTLSTKSAVGCTTLSITGTQTVNGTFFASTTSPASRWAIRPSISTGTTNVNINAANVSLTNIDFSSVTAGGAAAPFSGTSIGNAGGNVNIIGSTPKTVYWSRLTGGDFRDNAFATSSGGTPNYANFPIPQDTLIIDEVGLTTGGSITFSLGYFFIPNILSTRTTTWTAASGGLFAIFCGDITVNLPCTWTAPFNYLGVNKTINSNIIFAGVINFYGISGTTSIANASFSNTTAIYSAIKLLADVTGLTTFFNFYRGSIDLNNLTLTTRSFFMISNDTKQIAFGSFGKINLNPTTSSGTIFSSVAVGFSYTGTSNINVISEPATAYTYSFTVNSSTTESQALNFNFSSISNVYNISGPAVANSITLSGPQNFISSTKTIYGNLTLAPTSTFSSGTNILTFAGASGTKTITTSGRVFNVPVTFNGNCTWEFQDALTMLSTRALTFTQGTVRLKAGTTNTIGTFATSGATLKYLASTTAGSQATLSQATGAVATTFLSIKDSNATGGATFDANIANGNVNAGNNAGWDFGVFPIDVLISESISLQDASDSTQIFFKAISEALGLADPSTVAAAFKSAASEAIASADSVAGGTAFASSILESLVVDDSSTVLKIFNVSIDEPQTIQDAATVIASFISSVNENNRLSDIPTVAADFLLSATENIEVLGGEIALKTQYATATESQTLQEEQSTNAGFLSRIAENTGLADSLSGTANFVSDVFEPTTIQESIIGVAAKIIADVTEALTVSNAQTAVVSFIVNTSEGVSVEDGKTVVKTQYAILVEPLTLGEEQNVFAWVKVENDTPTTWSLIDNRQ